MYSVRYSETAAKFLDRLNQKDRLSILMKVDRIRSDPFIHVKRLTGFKLWRLRVGKLRVVLDISGSTIFVVAIGYRKNIYNDL